MLCERQDKNGSGFWGAQSAICRSQAGAVRSGVAFRCQHRPWRFRRTAGCRPRVACSAASSVLARVQKDARVPQHMALQQQRLGSDRPAGFSMKAGHLAAAVGPLTALLDVAVRTAGEAGHYAKGDY